MTTPTQEPPGAGPGPRRPPGRRAWSTNRESRYRRRPPADQPPGRDPEANRVLRLVLTEPDTVAMTQQQHEQAIGALSAMIVSWLRRRAHHGQPPNG